jgi:hypothetical protein
VEGINRRTFAATDIHRYHTRTGWLCFVLL